MTDMLFTHQPLRLTKRHVRCCCYDIFLHHGTSLHSSCLLCPYSLFTAALLTQCAKCLLGFRCSGTARPFPLGAIARWYNAPARPALGLPRLLRSGQKTV